MDPNLRTVAEPTPGEMTSFRRKTWPWWIDLWIQLVKTKPLATVGLVILVFFMITGMFSVWIAPEGVNEAHTERLERIEGMMLVASGTMVIPGPSVIPFHPFGLDNVGRDLLSRVIHGARVSMIVAVGAVALGVGLGTIVGIVSAWLGGAADTAIQRVVDAWLTFPTLIILIVVVTLLGHSPPAVFDRLGLDTAHWAMFKIILSLGVVNIAWYVRVIRSAALVIKEQQYVDAARALGATGPRIMARHISPNVMAPAITLATLGMGGAILSEATLSFLGYGIPPPNASWGGMLSTTGQLFLYQAPWVAFFPGVAVTLVVLGINLLGDGLRDLLDPRLRGQT